MTPYRFAWYAIGVQLVAATLALLGELLFETGSRVAPADVYSFAAATVIYWLLWCGWPTR